MNRTYALEDELRTVLLDIATTVRTATLDRTIVAGAEDSKFKKGDGNAELYEAGKFVAIYPGVRAL